VNINFRNLSDQKIAESLYKTYGKKLVYYTLKSWQLDEDDAWDILYETLYSFIHNYADREYESQKQVDALIWKIFKNKLRDRLRQVKRIEKDFQLIVPNDPQPIDNIDALNAMWAQCESDLLSPGNSTNPVLIELEKLLENCQHWERQLLICRANNIPYKTIAHLTGKNESHLKVYYQRMKQKIQSSMEQKFLMRRKSNE